MGVLIGLICGFSGPFYRALLQFRRVHVLMFFLYLAHRSMRNVLRLYSMVHFIYLLNCMPFSQELATTASISLI